MFIDEKINEILKEEIALLELEMKDNLSRAGKGSSALYKSIKGTVSDGSATVRYNDYGRWIDEGVTGIGASNFKGKKRTVFKSHTDNRFGSGRSKGFGSFEKDISKWMSSKGIKNSKSTNYLIRRSIMQHGIKGTLFSTNAFEEFRIRLEERLRHIDFEQLINISK